MAHARALMRAGLVPVLKWRPRGIVPTESQRVCIYAGVARKR
ncbi:MAG TPA: hypothetical protein VFY38_15140 [Pseudonocardia sp.]|nr:hypothetical protein [Pseudonocardia sp.]